MKQAVALTCATQTSQQPVHHRTSEIVPESRLWLWEHHRASGNLTHGWYQRHRDVSSMSWPKTQSFGRALQVSCIPCQSRGCRSSHQEEVWCRMRDKEDLSNLWICNILWVNHYVPSRTKSLTYCSKRAYNSGLIRLGSEKRGIAVAVPIDQPIMAKPPVLRSALIFGTDSFSMYCLRKSATWIARRSRKTFFPLLRSSISASVYFVEPG